MDIKPYLKFMVDKNASDIFFITGVPVHIRVNGPCISVGDAVMQSASLKKLAYSIMNDSQIKEFEADHDYSFAISVAGLGRFRFNIFKQRGDVAIVVRYILDDIPTVESLQLPAVLTDLVMKSRGLILVVGTAGSGKSTTLAAMIEHRNINTTGHILTIENPIEYFYKSKKSIMSQRELGQDFLSYESALRKAVRLAPDVVMVGEICDQNSMQHVISYAESGRLCLSSLHASNAIQAIDRITNLFPSSFHGQIMIDLSLNLSAIITQRLICGKAGGIVPAVEVMVVNSYISELISKGKYQDIKVAMEQGALQGMQTFDQALFMLYKEGKITFEETLRYADSRNNLSLRIKMSESRFIQDNSKGQHGKHESHHGK